MKIAIVGLPNSGKTTVFNALTRKTAETAAFSSGRLAPNLASVKVPDPRLDVLANIYKPHKLTAAEVQYVDVSGFKGEEQGTELSAEILGYIGTADALLHVVRAFEDESVPHPSGAVNPEADLGGVDLELIFSDLVIIERRLERLEKELKKTSGQEKNVKIDERNVLLRLKESLEKERPIRDLELTSQEEKLIRGYPLLSQKPVLVVLNIGEEQLSAPPNLEYHHSKSLVVPLSGKIEEELTQLEETDAREFMENLGIQAPARDRVIASSYALLGLISFLTVGEDEVRAWTICQGAVAVEAGGVIHSDIERGFIRAEVISFENLVESGSMASARKQGLVKLEGRQYVLQDGDISHFLFNV
ncbi:MAG: redox-regulated ATPase YchF [Acidobacteriota bacterium]|nr:redox-regulated ATPase YchF [Acidobacteriota bacterium]